MESQTNTNSINVNDAGPYGVTVTAKSKCEYVDQVEVMGEFDLESLQNFMEEKGFGFLEFDLDGSSLKSEASDSRSSCDVMNLAGNDYILSPNITGEPLSLEQVLYGLVVDGCNQCNYEAMGYIQSYTCVDGSFDMDGFLKLGNEVDGYVKTLVVEDTEKGKLLVFHKNTIGPGYGCIDEDNDQPGIVKDILYDLICGVRNEETNLTLNYTLPDERKSFVASGLQLLPYIPSFDNINGPYFNFSSIKISNLLNGRSIILPDADNLVPTSINKICANTIVIPSNPLLYPADEYLEISGDFWEYKFLYESSDPDCIEHLFIYLDQDEIDDFQSILLELIKASADEPAVIFDVDNAINATINLTGTFEVLQSIPPCILGDDILCDVINKSIYPPEIEGTTFTASSLKTRATSLAELIKTNSITDAQKILNCIHNKTDDGPYLVDDIYKNFGYNANIINGLTSLFYTLNVNTEPSSLVQGADIYDIYASYGYANSFEDFNDLYTDISFTHKVAVAAPVYVEPITISEINDQFEHYVPYLVQVSDLDVPLLNRHGFTMGSLGIVPGVYVPYLLENAASKTTSQTLVINGLAIGFVFAISDVGALYSAGQLASLEGAFALADLSIVGLDLMASIDPICDGLGIEDWCKDWKEVSTELAIFAFSGRVLSSKVAQMQRLKNKWNHDPKVKDAIRGKHGDNIISLLDDLFGKVGTNLKSRLTDLYPDLLESKIDDIISKFGNQGWFLATDEMALKILQPGKGGEDLIDDLLKTAGAEEKIGHNLAYVTIDHVDAWQKLFVRNVPSKLRKNFNFIGKLKDNPKLINLIDVHNPAGKSDFANKVDKWIKLSDCRPYLKSSNWDEVIKLFNGNKVSSYVDPSTGYKFVIGGGTDPFPGYISKATQVINSNDVSIVAQNFANALGIPNQTSYFENILSVCKEHMFMKSHLVEVDEGIFMVGRFEPLPGGTIDYWLSAKNNFTSIPEGGISANDVEGFKRLIAHEYIEAKLMQEGFHYKSIFWSGGQSQGKAFSYGADDLSFSHSQGGFGHWINSLGRGQLPPSIADDLSNLDEIVNWIKNIEGL